MTAVGGERTAGVEGSVRGRGYAARRSWSSRPGEGRRVGADTNKVLLPLAGSPVFTWSLRAAADLEYVDAVVVVVREADRGVVQRHLTGHEVVVPGGDTRHGSELNALQAPSPPGSTPGRSTWWPSTTAPRPLAGPDLFPRWWRRPRRPAAPSLSASSRRSSPATAGRVPAPGRRADTPGVPGTA